ncbi:hypothetical protein HDF16_005193 [Granulicella aggregans]|uniref:Uncharacterized protein n=1 Tax=Granulicella aggregans TaxID=474949 RepID=A0A7W7ZID4_9BACT|nr:hypothetical protein [Granulicella aggregans]
MISRIDSPQGESELWNGISPETATDRLRVEQFLTTTRTDLNVLCSSIGVDEQESKSSLTASLQPRRSSS